MYCKMHENLHRNLGLKEQLGKERDSTFFFKYVIAMKFQMKEFQLKFYL